MKRMRPLAIVFAAVAWGGCGNNVPTVFPHSLLGADGRAIVLDDLEAIVDDDDLTDDEKRSQLRELGLQDEELIDALLTL